MNQTQEMKQEQLQNTKRAFNKRLTFYHPNSKGRHVVCQLDPIKISSFSSSNLANEA